MLYQPKQKISWFYINAFECDQIKVIKKSFRGNEHDFFVR